METPFLSVEGINKSYGSHRALTDVSFSVPRGAIYGLLGPNGAGKTTLIRIINQILSADGGRLFFDGEPLRRDHVQRIGYLPEERGLYRKMKVGEQALFLARLKGMERLAAQRALKDWFERFGIEDWWNKRVENLSKGMAQKVQFIVTVLHRPALLIFDEPFSGFDPVNVELLKGEILRLQREGTTILFSTHNMESVEALCNHITLINHSRNVLSGSVEAIRRDFSEAQYELGVLPSRAAESALTDLPGGWRFEAKERPEGVAEGLMYGTLSHSDSQASSAALLGGLVEQGVEIRYFVEQRASMHSIFIRVVRESGQAEPENEDFRKVKTEEEV